MAYSRAFKRFDSRLEEVDHLRVLSRANHERLRRKEINQGFHSNALIRGATVLLSSHIQGYIEDLADLLIARVVASGNDGNVLPDTFRYFVMKGELTRIVQSDSPNNIIKTVRHIVANRHELLSLDTPLPSSLPDEKFKDSFGNPTTKEIGKFLTRLGILDLKNSLKKYLKNETYIASNAVDQIIDRRTKIAHGDPLATLTPEEFTKYLVLVRKFCAGTDKVACAHFRSIGCTELT